MAEKRGFRKSSEEFPPTHTDVLMAYPNPSGGWRYEKGMYLGGIMWAVEDGVRNYPPEYWAYIGVDDGPTT